MSNILVIDDDEQIGEVLTRFIQFLGHGAESVQTLSAGLERAAAEPFDIVILDVRLPDGNGLRAIPDLRAGPAPPEVIIITGEGSPEGARLAFESGSWDYLHKPLSTEEMRLALTRALQYREGKTRQTVPRILKREGIVGNSRKILACLEQAAQASISEGNVLIAGETGTGKELFARAIHCNSPRTEKAFQVVDCASLPETLVESTLFGHVRGAFTGATQDGPGLLAQAHGGTLFLDEIGELPLRAQASILRVLQEHRFRPVGGGPERVSHFRLVAATNRRLDELVQAGAFRQDLLFRLKSLQIHLPPLRERKDDILELTFHFIRKLDEQYGKGLKGASPDFFEALMKYDWPGNVRELEHTLQWAYSVSGEESTLYSIHLPLDLRSRLSRSNRVPDPRSRNPAVPEGDRPIPFPTLQERLAAAEREYLQELYSHTGGKIQDICRLAGMSRANVYARLKKHLITRT